MAGVSLDNGVSINSAAANSIVNSIYYPVLNVAGNTVTNPIAETAFISQKTMTANTLTVNQKIYISFRGRYSVPTGTLLPTAVARIKFGAITLVATPALSVGLGTGVEYGFIGQATLVVQSIGVAGQVSCGGNIVFQTAGGGAPTQAGVIVDTGTLTLNTTIDNTFSLTVISTPNSAGTYFKLTELDISSVINPSVS